MFDFFFKRKQVTLDCFTSRPHVYEYAKIAPGVKHFPDWWKKTPSIFEYKCPVSANKRELSIKHCVGLNNYYKEGIAIPSWFSLKLNVSSKKQKTFDWVSSDPTLGVHNHSEEQFSKFALTNGFNFKIDSPWFIRSNRKIYFTWTQPTWNMRSSMFDFSILPAVVDFHTQSQSHINTFIEYGDKAKTIFIEPAQPLVMLHALTECEVKIKNHLISDLEYLNLFKDQYMIFHWSSNIENSPLKSYRKWIKQRERFFNKSGDDNG